MATPLADIVGEAWANELRRLLRFALTFLVIYVAGRFGLVPAIDRIFQRKSIDAHARRPLKRLIRIAVIFVAVTVAFGAAGYGSFLTSLATVGAAATLA
ncbi:MAG: mechanosensitive ion channel family protein, partial [Halobacteriaceae archaeon]